MKQNIILFITCLFSVLTSYSQKQRSHFDIAVHTGANIAFPFQREHLNIKSYTGGLLGFNASYNKKRFSIRLQGDYVPSRFYYKFSHPNNSNLMLSNDFPIHTISYGIGFGIKVWDKNTHQLNLLFAMQIHNDIGMKSEKVDAIRTTSFYDPSIQMMNNKRVLAVDSDFDYKDYSSFNFGLEYKSTIKKIPIILQLMVITSNNLMENNIRNIKFVTFDLDPNVNRVLNATDWKRGTDIRVNIGTTLFSTKKK